MVIVFFWILVFYAKAIGVLDDLYYGFSILLWIIVFIAGFGIIIHESYKFLKSKLNPETNNS